MFWPDVSSEHNWEFLELVGPGHPVLRQEASPVVASSRETANLLKHCWRVLKASRGVGLAAPQLGIPWRVAVVDTGHDPLELINPVVIARSGFSVETEGCLSLPGIWVSVGRSTRITVASDTKIGVRIEATFVGQTARCIQHEIDHLNGRLIWGN